jgi:hypothetical protein
MKTIRRFSAAPTQVKLLLQGMAQALKEQR